MLSLAISLLWLLIYAICFAGVVWLVLYGIREFIAPIPAQVEKGIWFIVLLLVVIAMLTVLSGGMNVPKPFFSVR